MLMVKKRFCLIGRELGAGSEHGAYLGAARLQEVLEWAERQAFDGVGVLCVEEGVVLAGELAPEGDAGLLLAMGPKARTAWAGRICEKLAKLWGLEERSSPSEVVLLCGVTGYQEVAETLRDRLPRVTVTRPIAGTGIVNRASLVLARARRMEAAASAQ